MSISTGSESRLSDEVQRPRMAYSVDEFAEDHGVGRNKVYDEIKSGRLKSKRFGKRRLILAEDAKAWRESLPDGAA